MTWVDGMAYVMGTIFTALVAMFYITVFGSILYTAYAVYTIDRRLDRLDTEYGELMDVYDRSMVSLIKEGSSE